MAPRRVRRGKKKRGMGQRSFARRCVGFVKLTLQEEFNLLTTPATAAHGSCGRNSQNRSVKWERGCPQRSAAIGGEIWSGDKCNLKKCALTDQQHILSQALEQGKDPRVKFARGKSRERKKQQKEEEKRELEEEGDCHGCVGHRAW